MSEQNKPVSYTNRKGKTYYLHAAKRKSGKTVYVMKLSSRDALTQLPEGYEIMEGVNGQVSVGRSKPRQITVEEETLILEKLQRLGLKYYRCEAKDAYLTVYAPVYSETAFDDLSSVFPNSFIDSTKAFIFEKMQTGPLEPVMRFELIDEESRRFNIERMTYRGAGDWHSLWKFGALNELADKFLPHLGKDSFFDLI